jgi:Na+/H+ antiporter NhaA
MSDIGAISRLFLVKQYFLMPVILWASGYERGLHQLLVELTCQGLATPVAIVMAKILQEDHSQKMSHFCCAKLEHIQC